MSDDPDLDLAPDSDLAKDSAFNAAPPSVVDDDEPTEAYWMLVAAGKIWAEACGYFGDPREMFRHPLMRARQRSIVADWVRSLEMLVRRVILMVALKLEIAPRPPRPTPAAEPDTRQAKPHSPFQALRPTLTIMPALTRGRGSFGPPQSPISQLRLHTLARRLVAINDAIINAHIYARRTAFALARIAERHRNKPHPIIGLRPWAVREEKLTSGQGRMYDEIDHAQGLCLDQLDLWHERLLEPG